MSFKTPHLTKLPKAEDRKLINKLRDVLHSIKVRDMTKLIKLLSKEDRPDLNYQVPLKRKVLQREFYKQWVSPLQYACEKGTPEMVGAILAAGAMVNIRPHSPLTYAICSLKVNLVDRLLHSGATPNESGDPNEWDMAAAINLKERCVNSPEDEQKRREIITLLCKAGCDVNMCMHSKQTLGDREILNKKGIKIRTVYQPPLLFHAVSEGDLEMCKVLLESGAEVTVKDSLYNETALHIAMDSTTERNLPIIELLLAYGADPNHESKDGSSLLHLAVKRGKMKTVGVLVQAGTNRAALDREGRSPLHLAAADGHSELVDLLCLPEVLNSPDKDGLTALHLAADRGSLTTVRALLDAGADSDVKTPVTKVSPLDMALHNNHQKVADFLKMNRLLQCDHPGVTHASMPELSAKTQGNATTSPKILVTEPEEESQSLKEKLRKQEQEIELLKQEIDELKQETAQQKEEITQQKEEIDKQKEEISHLKEQHRTVMTETDKTIASLRKQLQKYQVIQYEENSNPVPMSDPHKQALMTNWPQFLQDLHHGVVVPSLVAEGILTPHMEEEIIKAYHTRRDRNTHLLDMLLTRGDQAFYVFRQALRKDPGSAHLAALLNVD
ncbi:serine/threonine-protein phosphatase 6 regulatory ankyrin repeat subunit A-like [Branchiostoma floridae]|uniref:Serine/threonine-protein phosphatase 6 regulatory ankyrin repeat subunit A-like n=2 Tax=Branchiostoma floridae TaxID=7739 RepID=A0A9J7KLD2_BRAFL|nr:serine/threonine-protein phosphatase 6 regulatory ankyrin repeat subunit A-like [Branchiostoma floridae]